MKPHNNKVYAGFQSLTTIFCFLKEFSSQGIKIRSSMDKCMCQNTGEVLYKHVDSSQATWRKTSSSTCK